MMVAKIYIGGNDVTAGRDHSYLLYDPDIDDNDSPLDGNDVQIIRGGRPQNHNIVADPISPPMLIELLNDGTLSVDWFDGGDMDDRRFRELSIGSEATSLWSSMKYFAMSMGNLESFTAINGEDESTIALYNTDLIYIPIDVAGVLAQNSNSVVNTILNVFGIDFRTHTPLDENDPNNYAEANLYPAHMALIDGSGDSYYKTYIHQNDSLNTGITNFQKRGGADEISLRWDSLTDTHAKLEVNNNNDSDGLTTIIMNGLDWADVGYAGIVGGDLIVGLEENIYLNRLVTVKDFYDDRTLT